MNKLKIDKFFAHPGFNCSKTNLFTGVVTLRYIYSYTFKDKRESKYVKIYGEMKNGIFLGPVTFETSKSSFNSFSRWTSTKKFLVKSYTELSGSKLTKLPKHNWPAPWGSESKWKLSLKAKVDLLKQQKKQADLKIEMEGPFLGLKRIEKKS